MTSERLKKIIVYLQIAIFAIVLLCPGTVSVMAMEDTGMMTEHEEISPFEKHGIWGFKDGQGKVVTKARFHTARNFLQGGIAAVVDERGWAYIDKKGNVVIRPFLVDNGPDYFQEGLARFSVDQKFGFFDNHGRIIILPRFDFAFPFHEGLAAACMGCGTSSEGEHHIVDGRTWGYIDHNGKWAISPIFESARPFVKGKAQVTWQGKCVYIDQKGTVTSASTAKEDQGLLNQDPPKKQ